MYIIYIVYLYIQICKFVFLVSNYTKNQILVVIGLYYILMLLLIMNTIQLFLHNTIIYNNLLFMVSGTIKL